MQTGQQQSATQRDRTMTFEEYFNFDDGTDYRYELTDGVLVQLPPESGRNLSIASYLFLKLVEAGISYKLIGLNGSEVQVPVLKRGDAANRYPDLMILEPVHKDLTRQRMTIRLEMPPPRLIVEVVSPGKANQERDYVRKRAQYEAMGIPEYWLIDPQAQTVTVLQLRDRAYVEVGSLPAIGQL